MAEKFTQIKCPICNNDSTYNINDIDKLIPMLNEAIAQYKIKGADKVLTWLKYNLRGYIPKDSDFWEKYINFEAELKGGQDDKVV